MRKGGFILLCWFWVGICLESVAQPTLDTQNRRLTDSLSYRQRGSVGDTTRGDSTRLSDDSLLVATLMPWRPGRIWDSIGVLPPGSIRLELQTRLSGEPHEASGKEGLFYSLLGMVMVLALFRRFFPKYWSDLFRLFFRTTLRQRQLRDQMELATWPSVLLNVFFFVCMAFYLNLLLSGRGWNPFLDFWTGWAVMLGFVSAMYFVKWMVLQLSGWIFGQQELGADYSFLVFTVNKVMGLMLLPAVIGMAFAAGRVWEWSFILSVAVVAGLLLYRAYLTYRMVRQQAGASPFHFVLYWFGFELAPLLVLYRFLLGFFSEMA